MTESCPLPPSSLTCVSSSSPVQLNSTEDLQTWLQQASPANHSATQESDVEPLTSETCGLPPSNAFAWYDQSTHSWRTFQACLLVDILEPFSATWPRQGMTQDGLYYPQPIAARRTKEKGYGYVPTPRANEHGDYQYDRGNHDKPRPTLTGWVKMFPTPVATDAGSGRINRSASPNAAERPTLAMMAKQNNWPTPTTRDWRSGKASQATMEKNSRPLSEAVMWRTPSSQLIDPKKSVVKLTGRTPQDPQVGLADQVGGKLNPDWTEWLMGWPIGWTDLKPLGMARFQSWLQQHGEC